MQGGGLSLSSGLRFRASAAQTAGVPNTGTVETAAFSPGATQSPQSKAAALHPATPQGLTFWVGVAAIGLLALLRHSLPN